ncbi:enterochelin esterase family protein [Catenuloplanes nepalensis]|uniref:Enterochelin esterase family protein n=1 Tax=Catenuloplanes nepalensis TaxID=587533 RepID=A0ABT9MSH6_9ACTN|nr:alpha/beta hydrolase-fold protein [Catenuloplanes nepalensis]MDP9794390.1 enterochelin esterase family protein [Catenuloplanes nepalensis]
MIDERIGALLAQVREGAPEAAERLWHAARAAGGPLISAGPDGTSLVTFVWRGEAAAATVCWGVEATLARVPGTDLWHATVALPSRLRTLYYLGHGAAGSPQTASGTGVTHIDPLNPRTVAFPRDPGDPTDRDGFASLLELPDAPPEPWLSGPPVPAGPREQVEVPSAALGGVRRVTVHRPAHEPIRGANVLVVFDGHLAQAVLCVPELVDRLVAAGRIPPAVVLYVHIEDARRDRELGSTPEYTEFVARELIPWARTEYGVTTDPARAGLAGASLGGLTAAHIALAAPDVFGRALSHSGSFWRAGPAGEPEWLTRQYATRPRADLRLYLDVGDRETGPGPAGAAPQVDVNRRLRDVLLAKGYPLDYREYLGGHDYVNWRRLFPDALTGLFGR